MLANSRYRTMCLSEPQAGSSLADIRTRAVLSSDGRYRLFGNKMWISGGDHDISENIVHLVLAKIPDENGQLLPGVQGAKKLDQSSKSLDTLSNAKLTDKTEVHESI